MIIDADAHVEEWEETFADKYFDPSLRAMKPRVVGVGNQAYWLIEDKLLPKLQGKGCQLLGTPTGFGIVKTELTTRKPETLESMELRNVAARLADMDKEGIDVQVILPTLAIAYPLADSPRLATAICRSYNNWMADICAQRADRLKWLAMVPLQDVSEAVKELRRSKQELGAIGVFMLGAVGEKTLDDPEFDPVYSEASRLDQPLIVHVGWGCPLVTNLYDSVYNAAVLSSIIPVFMGFLAILGGGVLDRFPELRVGFFEVGSQWIPFLIERMDHFYEVRQRIPYLNVRATKSPSEYLGKGSVYFSCEVDEKLLPYVAGVVGEDHLVYASDIPHGDRVLDSINVLRRRTDLSERVKTKILGENAKRFYRL